MAQRVNSTAGRALHPLTYRATRHPKRRGDFSLPPAHLAQFEGAEASPLTPLCCLSRLCLSHVIQSAIQRETCLDLYARISNRTATCRGHM